MPSSRIPTDAELGSALRDGSESALAQLYDQHLPAVYDFLSRYLRDAAAAEELAHLTFVRAWEARESLQDPARVRGWLFRIAHNLAANHATRSRKTEPIDDQPGLAAATPDPLEAAMARELAELVWAAAASLEPRQYAVLDLHVRQDLPTGEIAQVLEVAPSHAAVLVNRAKEALGNAVRYLLVARRRDHCPRLAELLPAGLSSLTPEQRSSVDRHMRRCPECQGLARRLTAPAELFGALAPVPLPEQLRHQSRDLVLVAARRLREEEARLLAPRDWEAPPEQPARRPRRVPKGILALAGIAAMLLLAVAADQTYFHRPGPALPLASPVADLIGRNPNPTSTQTGTPTVPSPEATADASLAQASGDEGEASGPPSQSQSGQDGRTRRSGPAAAIPAGAQPAPAHAAVSTPSPLASATPTTKPTPIPTPTATPVSTPTPTAALPSAPPAPAPTPHQAPPPAPSNPPTPPPAPFAVTRVATSSAGCAQAGGYSCDFVVVVWYVNAPAGSAVSGALTASAATAAGPQVRSRPFSVPVPAGSGSVSIPVPVVFSTAPCAESSRAAAATSAPNAVSGPPAAFGRRCTPA
jgi:RNA polymerase sigma factor (sigma-70 family)